MKILSFLSFLLALLMFVSLESCSGELNSREEVIALYQKNEEAFLDAAQKGEFAPLEGIRGVTEVSIYEDHVDIYCGGTGFGSATAYYGIFYSAKDNLAAIWCAGPREQLVFDGNGYRYQEPGPGGDNQYYVEPLGNHFYYYEAQF
ncbi:MAG: hypothetical protein IIU86_02975 [Oscillospiraceae bacterium]|nr:hypothetical protein [Oscillospiraceae bacterium]